jgi:hypothetical protein
MAKLLHIPRILNVVAGCWDSAESALREEVRRNHPAAFEEVITDLFYGLFADALRNANETGTIVRSFVADLQAGIPKLRDRAVEIAHGIVCDVTLHGHRAEGISGGDLGFLVMRPHVSIEGDMARIRDYRRGLLCQAKRKKGRRFGSLSKSQRSVLPSRLPYLAILGYEFADIDGYDLEPFKWQPCHEASVSEIASWLAHGNLPSPVGSAEVLAAVASGRLGTDDNDIIKNVISPAGNRVLEIRIHWPRGGPPDGKVRVRVRPSHVQQLKVRA